MNTYHINDKKYYLSDDLMYEYPSFFKGCKTSRTIINKKNKLLKNSYIFARLNSKKWKISNGESKKFDKLFISKKWFDNNHIDNETDKIEIVPKIINLGDSEMFTNNNNEPINIEVRGEREFDKCFFRLS